MREGIIMVGQQQDRRAAKDYKCAGCGDLIAAGELYTYGTYLVDVEPDVDDEGRTVGVELPRDARYWVTWRTHLGGDPVYGCPLQWEHY